MGTTRRLNHFDDPTLQPFFIVAAIGVVIILVGILGFVMSIVMGIVQRNQTRDTTGDPWGARTLEWSTTSPPPEYNFAVTPIVYDLDAWQDMKDHGYKHPTAGFTAIHMPRNTGTGIYLSALAVTLGFGMIWYMWWLAAVSFAAILVIAIAHTFNYNREYSIPVDTVARTEGQRDAQAAARI